MQALDGHCHTASEHPYIDEARTVLWEAVLRQRAGQIESSAGGWRRWGCMSGTNCGQARHEGRKGASLLIHRRHDVSLIESALIRSAIDAGEPTRIQIEMIKMAGNTWFCSRVIGLIRTHFGE